MTPPQRARLTYPEELFHQSLEDAARLRPERVALRFEGELFTCRELDSLSNTIGNAMSDLGVRPFDRVAIYLANRPEWIVAFYAISKLGAAAVLVSPAWRAAEVRHAFSLTNPVAVISDGYARHGV